MEIVALPVQLTAQTPSAGEITDLSAVLSESLGKGLPQDIFAALLAQQMGAAGGAPLPQVVVGAGDSAQEDADELAAGQVDTLSGQLGWPGLVAISPMEAPAAGQPPVNKSLQTDVAQNIAAVNAKEIQVVGRQPVAVASADLAETAVMEMAVEGAKFVDRQLDQHFFANPVTAQSTGPSIPVPVPVAAPPVAQVIPQAIPQPVSSPEWDDMLGGKVMWMVGQHQQSAELHLNPPSLGPLEVRLSISDGQANLTFSTQHLPVREAIEAATPRLRDMLGESGIALGSVSVNVGSFTQQQPGEQREPGRLPSWPQAAPESDFSIQLPASVTLVGRNGMVDIFA